MSRSEFIYHLKASLDDPLYQCMIFSSKEHGVEFRFVGGVVQWRHKGYKNFTFGLPVKEFLQAVGEM